MFSCNIRYFFTAAGGSAGESSGAAGSISALRARLNALMQRAMGIERDEESLSEALSELEKMETEAALVSDAGSEPPYEGEALINSLMLARALVMSARERRESRGAHQRSDHPGESDVFLKRTVARRARESSDIKIYFEEI